MQHNVWTWQYVFATVLCLCNSSGPPVAQIPRGASNACIFPCICNILHHISSATILTACNTSPLSMDTPHPPYLLVKLMHFWYIARIHYILTPLQSFIMELHHRLQWRWYWTDKMVHRLVQQLAYTAINHTMPHHHHHHHHHQHQPYHATPSYHGNHIHQAKAFSIYPVDSPSSNKQHQMPNKHNQHHSHQYLPSLHTHVPFLSERILPVHAMHPVNQVPHSNQVLESP